MGAKHLGFGGLNVTIPHKEAVIKFIKPDPRAAEIGAANTIDFKKMMAFNTDAPAAVAALRDNGVDVSGRRTCWCWAQAALPGP